RRYVGAARLAAAAAYRVGAGLVTLAVPAEIRAPIAAGLPEAVYLPYDPADPAAPELVAGAVPEAYAVLVGCGLGQEPYAGELVGAV
ncbi:MAG: bifunctional ADP-dependent NAD(P)H-hydrate dehydratase/NAD(P)H-hydrate epimerase, partial [Chloroflexota bacterium]